MSSEESQLDAAHHSAAVICYRNPSRSADVEFRKMMVDPTDRTELATLLFDYNYYTSQYDVETEAIHPVLHYCLKGHVDKLSPHPLFQHDVVTMVMPHSFAQIPPLAYYIMDPDSDEISPHRLFSPKIFKKHLRERPDGLTLFESFLAQPVAESAEFSEFFSPSFYMHQSRIIRMSRKNILQHYYDTAVAERKDANPMFDSAFYRHRYPDVHTAGWDPLEHFVEHGYRENREPNPFALMENYGRSKDLSVYLRKYVKVNSEGDK
ncbi:MAG: hypothetical protein NXI26_24205 [bacterium]|nr:hypothetical protein [bacterium]